MARIMNVDLPNKRIVIALTYIYGIGLTTSKHICDGVGLDVETRANNLTEDQIAAIRNFITEHFIVESDLRRAEAEKKKDKRSSGCISSIRTRRGYPCRGQRTRSNARTAKRNIRKKVS